MAQRPRLVTEPESDQEFARRTYTRSLARWRAPSGKSGRCWSDNRHRALNMLPDRLPEVSCRRDQRHVGKNPTWVRASKRVIPDVNDLSSGPGRQGGGRLRVPGRVPELRTKGMTPRHAIFDKTQRLASISKVCALQGHAPDRPERHVYFAPPMTCLLTCNN